MSVINKMLRDLDSRQATTKPIRTSRQGAPAFMVGTDAVYGNDHLNPSPSKGRSRLMISVALMVGAILLGVAVFFGWNAVSHQPHTVTAATPSAPSVPVAKPPLDVKPVVQPVPLVATQPKVAVVAMAGSMVPAPVPQASASTAPTPPPIAAAKSSPKANSKAETPAGVPLNLELAGAVRAASAPGVTTAPAVAAMPVPVATSTPAPSLQSPAPRVASTNDVLAQAQALWTAGSRTTAIDMLSDAVLVTERSHGSNDALAALVRELVRMQMAQGQVAEALALLVRLEPQLGGEADLWAVRGNATQRLGRHAESTTAYLMALKLRPAEPRWMMGAAVSLAVQGRTAEAAEMAEQARTLGQVSPDLLAYLRQLGVRLREP